MKPNKKPIWWQYLAILTACLLCYGSALNGEFVFDDSVAIVQNDDVAKSNNINLWQIFYHDFWGNNLTDPTSHKSYRPLTILTFRWETILYGQLNATFMKTVNLALHCFVCCLLFGLLNEFLPNFPLSFLTSILFAIHPIHVEAVAGIVGRAELLCTIMFLLVFRIYLQIEKANGSIVQYMQLVTLATVALLCKETGITALPTCITYDIITNTNIRAVICHSAKLYVDTKKSLFQRRILIALITTILLVYLRLLIMNFESPKFKAMDNPVAASNDSITKILSQSFLYTLNFWLLLCPDWLSFDWALDSIQLVQLPNDIRIISIVLTYLILSIFIIKGRKLTDVGLVFLCIPFLPATGIVRLGFVIAERILYIPSIGFCLLVNIGFQKLCSQFTHWKCVLYSLYGFTLIILSLKTVFRAHEWRNEELLFKSALRVCPNNAKIYYNIGRLASDKNERNVAFEFYQKAISLYPDYEAAHMNLGNLYREINDLDMAEKYLRKSINLLEEFPAAWMNLGIVLAAKKQYTNALRCYKRAIGYRKRYATCYYNLGNLYIEMNEGALAVQNWEEAVVINPQHGKAWANILAYLDNNGRLQDVLDVSERALKFVPNDPAILFTRANAFGKQEQFEMAESIYWKIINQRPNHALYRVNLGVLYHRWNRRDDAIASYRIALELDASLKSAADNLNKLLLHANSA